MPDTLSRLRSFPKAPAPNDDASTIRGNCSLESKQIVVNAMVQIGVAGPATWGHEHAARLKMVEANIKRRPSSQVDGNGQQAQEVEVAYEIVVQDGMLNYLGTVAGSCITHLVDICTFGPWFILGYEQGVDITGVSIAVEMKFFKSASRGATLRIVTTSLSEFRGRVMSSRAEIYDKATRQLIAVGVHSAMALNAIQPYSPKARL